VLKVKFEDRAVAFIDVLGFRSLVQAADQRENKHTELETLIELLETAVPNLDGTVDHTVPNDLIPKHIYISDSIILSAPLTSSQIPGYRGLSILVMRIIQISHLLLSRGYLLRGGISVGSVWQTDSNIVGPAYQEAYQIETRTLAPRVELSPDARSHWISTEGSSNKMCLEYTNRFIVNGLHDYYIGDNTHGGAERVFERYHRIIDSNLRDANHPEPVRYKWWWFKEFLESEVKRNAYIIRA
jgi:hypothetical protein